MASHTFFCCEATCNAIAHVSGGRCDSCADMHSPSRCEWCHSGFDSENSVFLPSESGRFCNKWCEAGWRCEHTSASPKHCKDCGVRREATEPELLCDWFCEPCWQLRFGKKHVCSGEMDYELGHKVCDNRDDPFCPQHLALTCNTCGCTAEFRDGERVCWCDSCQRTGCDYEHHCSGENEYRPEERLCEDRADPRCPQHACADCGEKPEDGHFPYYRGNDPLCTYCAPNSDGPADWRESTGRCSKCDFFYNLICSSDRRDLCYTCQ